METIEDSLEEFIKASRNCKQEEPIKIKKEFQISAIRKRECDLRAMKIVEFSIDGKLRPEIFTRCLPHINQSHYQDIVEERAISKLCGYPICGKVIPDMPKKQYLISTKNNKVYDITDRKNYCCNFCYKASLHIKKQIDDSPLWLRKLDKIPKYHLLQSFETGLPGECIDQGIARPVVEPSFTSISMFADVSLDDMIKNEVGENLKDTKSNRRGVNKKVSKLKRNTMQTISENSEPIEDEDLSENIKVDSQNCNGKKNLQKKHENTIHTLPVIEEKEERLEGKYDETDDNIKEISDSSLKTKKSKKKYSKSSKQDIDSLLKRVFSEWLSLDSYIFLYGETKVKEILNEKKLSDYFDQLNIGEMQRNQQAKYMDICKKLQLQEMADEKFDRVLLGDSKLKPVPDYKKLKEETRDLNIKAKCFYSGVLHETDDSNFPTQVNRRGEGIKEEESPVVLPLADVNSQNALRRKIFLTSINKFMQQLLQSLRVTSIADAMSNLQSLVKTFRLKADNIVFKPVVWNYIAIILINMIAIQNEDIRQVLQNKSAQDYLDLLLSSLSNSKNLISDMMTHIEDIESFVEKHISSSS